MTSDKVKEGLIRAQGWLLKIADKRTRCHTDGEGVWTPDEEQIAQAITAVAVANNLLEDLEKKLEFADKVIEYEQELWQNQSSLIRQMRAFLTDRQVGIAVKLSQAPIDPLDPILWCENCGHYRSLHVNGGCNWQHESCSCNSFKSNWDE